MNKTLCAILLSAAAAQSAHADAPPAAAASRPAPGDANGMCATFVTPRKAEYPWMTIERWKQMHAEQVARAKAGNIDVMFLGDSITEGWPKPIWDAQFGQFKPANFGIGGDHTGNVLWRLQDPAIAALKPKVIVLLIGVNNAGLCDETAEQVFPGIQAVVAKLRAQYPSARILLNSVLPTRELPNDPFRQRIVSLNRMVATLQDGRQVTVVNYGPKLTAADGRLSADVMPDYLHLSPKGYQMWADAMRPDIEKLLK